jgi:oligopeptide/dipeptide ABC transporter ATP-binding protein
VVFDEPVSALDVSVQAQIIALIRRLQASAGFASAFISHDLRVVRHVADHVAVMYLGRIVEQGPVVDVFRNPAHPYTRALLSAVPRVRRSDGAPRPRLIGDIASPTAVSQGCPFHPRCPEAKASCLESIPLLRKVGQIQAAACHLLSTPITAPPSKEFACA